tara:strand:+ start:2859 stop:3566 length:708 start_codon:yes stop_codon:yes gene_type:complete
MKQKLFFSEENQFSLSVGDLMAALLMIFILLLVGTMLRLQEEFDEKSLVAEKYEEIQDGIYTALKQEFKDSESEWQMEIDSNLTIRFTEPTVKFASNSSTLKPNYKDILSDFFPRYIEILYDKKFIDHIDEIRIEGHTSKEGRTGDTDKEAYFYNMELSQDRTRSVLKYCLAQIKDDSINVWTQTKTTANGLSSVKRLNESGTEKAKNENRRVEFKVKTDAEKQIKELLKISDEN